MIPERRKLNVRGVERSNLRVPDGGDERCAFYGFKESFGRAAITVVLENGARKNLPYFQ